MNQIQAKLQGPNAFYLQPDYLEQTKKAMALTSPPAPVYIKNFTSPISRISKLIASIIFFPIGLYKTLHCVVGSLAVVPGVVIPRSILNKDRLSIVNQRKSDSGFSQLAAQEDWKFLRTSIKVDGSTIDVFITLTPQTARNKRWTLYVGGNAQPYEQTVDDSLNLLADLKSNGIYFNYRGVGSSSRFVSQDSMVKAYQAMLSFLEDDKNGIGAKEIILYGWSLGAAVQGKVLQKHSCDTTRRRYVAVKDQTFSDLRKVAAHLTNRVLAFLLKLLGWNIVPATNAHEMTIPEIVLQGSPKNLYEELHSVHDIVSDGMIPQNGSYAQEILSSGKSSTAPKLILAAPPIHSPSRLPTKPLADHIIRLLAQLETA
jgi:alpha/beta superfamily hydrolase